MNPITSKQILHVSFTDDKKMVMPFSNKDALDFKGLREVKEGDRIIEPKVGTEWTRINVINDSDGKLYTVKVKTEELVLALKEYNKPKTLTEINQLPDSHAKREALKQFEALDEMLEKIEKGEIKPYSPSSEDVDLI